MTILSKTTQKTAQAGRDPFSDEPEVLLIRPQQGGRPALYFKHRGCENIWSATLEKLIGGHTPPDVPPKALLAIGPHLIRAEDEARDHLYYRQYNRPLAHHDDGYTRYLHTLPGPVLGDVHFRLRALSRRYRALDLLARFFPHALRDVTPAETWSTIFRRFLALVENEDWFPLDHQLLNAAWEQWHNDEDEGEWLAEYLTCIPLPIFAPFEEYLASEQIRILYGLLVNSYVLNKDDLRPYGLPDAASINEEAISERIAALAGELRGCEHPLNFLPEVAAVYRRETDLSIVDEPGRDDAYLQWYTGDFTWERDVHQVRQEWQQARPLIDRLNAFHAWCEQDERHFDRAVRLILQTGGYTIAREGGHWQ